MGLVDRLFSPLNRTLTILAAKTMLGRWQEAAKQELRRMPKKLDEGTGPKFCDSLKVLSYMNLFIKYVRCCDVDK